VKIEKGGNVGSVVEDWNLYRERDVASLNLWSGFFFFRAGRLGWGGAGSKFQLSKNLLKRNL